MLQKARLFVFVIILINLFSCTSAPRSVYYAPEESNMLKLAQKNDFKTSFSTSNISNDNLDRSNHFNTQIAYSPIKHLGIFGNYVSNGQLISSRFRRGYFVLRFS